MSKIKQVTFLILMATALLAGGAAYAQTGGGYDLSRHTVEGGGDTLTGSGYTLNGATGQPDASAALSGSGYSLSGGFWNGSSAGGGGQNVYLPIVVKNQ